ncbi:MAG TPA: cysteine desulfurase [Tepidisphaeraceae bacterium]|nr:cysteine desulfurase [Tepidisphaeraceae bacterium]
MHRPSADLLSPPRAHTAAPLDPHAIRPDFPILGTACHQKPLIYLDNAATTQKPRQVIDTESRYYNCQNANIHRGVYTLSQLATDLHENARRKVRKFINAAEDREVIFTRSTTESINLVASSFGRANIKTGDEIIISGMEHHSNIVPWQILCQQTGAILKVIPFNDRGELLMDEYQKLLSSRTRIISIVHLSNSLGTINPIEQIIALAHRHGIPVLVDGAQWVAHRPLDVRALDADFYCFSGHKLYGPTGIGILYGKAHLLESMPPYQGGGDMISSVTFERTTYNDLPYKFEAGTPNIAGAIALGSAIDYIQSIGLDRIAAHEDQLFNYATQKLQEIPELRLVGTAKNKASVLSFVLHNIHPHDVGTILDGEGIAVRTGHHCCQPVMDRLDIPATARASIAAYNTKEEIDALATGIEKVIAMFA